MPAVADFPPVKMFYQPSSSAPSPLWSSAAIHPTAATSSSSPVSCRAGSSFWDHPQDPLFPEAFLAEDVVPFQAVEPAPCVGGGRARFGFTHGPIPSSSGRGGGRSSGYYQSNYFMWGVFFCFCWCLLSWRPGFPLKTRTLRLGMRMRTRLTEPDVAAAVIAGNDASWCFNIPLPPGLPTPI